MNTEAFITGIGVISPLGANCTDVLDALRNGRDGIVKATKLDLSPFVSHICGEVINFNPSEDMSADELALYTDPFIRLAICAARRALKNAKIDITNCRVAYVLATCNAGLNSREAEYAKKHGADVEFDRRVFSQSEFCSLQKALVSALGKGGACYLINTACSGSTAAIGMAQNLAESGKYDAVLVGGADALAISNFAGFSAIKVVSPEKIAPFSTPEGMNIGEGAAFWVVENSNYARQRGANVLGKIIGNATTADAHHPTQPDPRGDGVYRTLRNAAADAGITPEKIGCVNAHGSGTSANDRAESKGIKRFLGSADVPTTSTKSYMGHCMGATGILEATSQLLSMNADFIPPTLRNSGARAGCEITAVKERIDTPYDTFISANYAFGGNNAAVVIAKENFKTERPNKVGAKSVAITGMGVVNSLGFDFASNIEKLRVGESAIKKMSRIERSELGGLIEPFNSRAIDRRVDFSGMNPISVYATLATKRAFDLAGVRMGRADAESTGLTSAMSRGASEDKHMDAVFINAERRGDVGCFSTSTANSTAGWVSKALEIKGANITLTSGANGGLQALEHAVDVLRDGRAKRMVAFSADELCGQLVDAYSKVGYLYDIESAEEFKLRSDDEFKTVFAECACAVLLEDLDEARARGATIYGEILSAVSYEEPDEFLGANLNGEGFAKVVNEALKSAEITADEVGLIVWSPRGDAQDDKIINLRNAIFAKVPMITDVFNTGYAESASILSSLTHTLFALKNDGNLWQQKTGNIDLDNTEMQNKPRYILSVGSSHTGNNFAVVIKL